MRSGFVLGIGIALAIMAGACSSADEKPKVSANSTVPVSASNSSITASSVNSNGQALVNGTSVQPQSVDANTVTSADPITPPMQSRLDKMRAADTAAGSADVSISPVKNSRPAPDNSTFTTYLTDAGYEIRTFKNNPVLLKVEKKIEGNGNQTIKVFLRNSKVVELPGNAISPLSTASANEIASAAGLNPAPPKEAATGSTGTKKSGN